MNSKTKTILSLIIFVLFLAGAYFVYNGFVNKSQPDTGNTQPPDTVQQNSGAQPDENNGSDAQPDENNGSGAEGVTEDETEQSEEKLKALDFTVYDKEGNKVNLSDFYGKPIIINFWATWCPYCVEEMPLFEEKYKEYGEEINFLMVDAVDGNRETKEKGEKFIEDSGFTFPVYFDTDEDASYTYQAYSLPTTVFIDADGYIIAYQPGMLTPDMMQKGIDLILGTEPDTVAHD
jgi:thiol-disulfide isomerase/thioredoxin